MTKTASPEHLSIFAAGCAYAGDLKRSEELMQQFLREYSKDWRGGPSARSLKIPLDRFTSGKGAAFDKKTAWELAVGTWSTTPQNLDVYLDDVAFQ